MAEAFSQQLFLAPIVSLRCGGEQNKTGFAGPPPQAVAVQPLQFSVHLMRLAGIQPPLPVM